MLDGGDGLVDETARGHAGLGPKVGGNAGPGLWILADHPFGQLTDDPGQARVPAGLVELGPSDEACVGLQLQERDGPPAAVCMQIVKAGDAHGLAPSYSPDMWLSEAAIVEAFSLGAGVQS